MFYLVAQIDIVEDAEQKVNWVSSANFALMIILVSVFIIISFFIYKWLKQRSSARGVPISAANKEMRQRIQHALSREEYEKAGDLLTRQRDFSDAGEAYIKGGNHPKAARAFLAMGNEARAIHYFKQAGDHEQAAKLYAGRDEHMSAAAEYVLHKRFDLSAKHYKLAGDSRRAAENFEKANAFREAAECYEKSERPLRAAENYQRYFEEELARVDGDLSAFAESKKLAQTIGKLFQNAGKNQQAANVFRKAELFEEAASAMQDTGNFTAAAELLIQANRPLKAAEVLENAGHGKRAFVMRAEAAIKAGELQEAIHLFIKAEHFENAAEICRQLDNFFEAGELFEKSARLNDAIDCYEKAEKFAHAAKAAEELQDWVKAAAFAKKAGDVDGEIRALVADQDFFRAGRLQFEHRRYNDAIATLANIESTNPMFPRALELQGDAFQGQSRFEKAYSRFRASLGNRGCGEDTLYLFYKMGRCLEEEKDLTGALSHYKNILTVDRTFQDVELRSQTISRRLKRGTIPGASASGIFSTPDGVEAPRYEILGEVARGGMGIVYKARDAVLGRIVAYKILGENLRDNATAVKYFLREARAAAALSHPNIVTIFDAGEQEGEYYMAMEFVEGTTLKQVIKRRGALPEEQVRFIGIHCCRALSYAHSKGIVHRDIKSGNVMITRDKALKIMDFGLAKFMREYQKEHTQQVGTPFYMSPEQIIGKNIDFRSDLYSVGCTIFECATGQVPFIKGDLSYHHVHTLPPDPKQLNPKISKGLRKIILKLLEKHPDKRYQNAQEVIDAIMSE